MELTGSSVFFSDKPHSLNPDSLLSGGVWGPQSPLYPGLLDALWAQHSKSVPGPDWGHRWVSRALPVPEEPGPLSPPMATRPSSGSPSPPWISLWVVWLPSSTAWTPGGMDAAFGDEGPPVLVSICNPLSKGDRNACLRNVLEESIVSGHLKRQLLEAPGFTLDL